MCGIAGIFSPHQSDHGLLEAMTDTLNYRGPDNRGFFCDEQVSLGHRRLSIIDLETGDQPMFNDSKSIALVYNGEIYNYIELREDLVNLGPVFRTESDSEVIVRAH